MYSGQQRNEFANRNLQKLFKDYYRSTKGEKVSPDVAPAIERLKQLNPELFSQIMQAYESPYITEAYQELQEAKKGLSEDAIASQMRKRLGPFGIGKKKAEEERQKEIKQALEKYFPSISIPQDIEKEISALAIPLRTYLQLHLFMGEDINYRKQRIALTLKLCEIAVRIYKRHVPETDILGTLDGAIRYRFTTIFPHYGHDVKEIEKSCQDDAMRKSLFADYYEVNRALKEFLPPVGNNLLNNYLNHTVRRILCIFSYDTDYLECHHIKDAWGNRILSDEMDYKRNYKEMKMPQFQSLILPEKFSDEQISDFIKNYSLR